MTNATLDPQLAARDARGDWRPANPIQSPPASMWPADSKAVLRWLFAWPGYLWPFNAVWLLVAVMTWAFLTPDLKTMQTLELWWVGLVLARNTGFTVLLYSGLHLYLHVLQRQGDAYRFTTRPLVVASARFRFRRQAWDNMFYTLVSGVPAFTAFEVLTYWGFANGLLGYGLFEPTSGVFWFWTCTLVLIAPAIHSAHF